MPTPSSSDAPTGRCARYAPISAGCSAASSARPGVTSACAGSSPNRCRWPSGCAASARTSVAQRACPRAPSRGSIRCTRPRWNASARARRIAPMSSASRCRWRPRSPTRRAGSSSPIVKALPGNPYDGHTLETVIPEIEAQIGASLARIIADRGYRGHNAPPDHRFKVYISGQRRRVTETIKRELRRRSAVEPVIGHTKAEHRMGRNYLAGTHGDAANAVLAAAGYNFRRLLVWLALLLSAILAALTAAADHKTPLTAA